MEMDDEGGWNGKDMHAQSEGRGEEKDGERDICVHA